MTQKDLQAQNVDEMRYDINGVGFIPQVGRVDQFTANGETTTIVFTGDPGEHDGAVYVIDSFGKLATPRLRPLKLSNDNGDRLCDFNDDGLPELVRITPFNLQNDAANGDNETVFVTCVRIEPLTVGSPEMTLIFDRRNSYDEDGSYSCEISESQDHPRKIVLERGNQLIAEFEWSNEAQAFVGPEGSFEDGFAFSPSNLPDVQQIFANWESKE